MPRDYTLERNAVLKRWYGRSPGPHSRRGQDHIKPDDCLGVPIPVNPPFRIWGHCMVWKYGLNRGGYGMLTVDGEQKLAHRVVYTRTRGEIPEGKQINHLCNRPYCVQPAHLYAGTQQDNRDDSEIFHNPDHLHTPGMAEMLLGSGQKSDNPLIQRLQESERHDFAEPWEPVEHPPQVPLEEWTCPQHDFDIPMFGGNSKICRICEISEFQEENAYGEGAFMVIAEICPASQTVNSIFEKILQSEFMQESHSEMRHRAFLRSRMNLGSHDLRDCGCRYCTQDCRTFRAAIQPLLTREEANALDLCDRLAPRMTAMLEEASIRTMELWALPAELNEEQKETLRNHYRECPNSKSEMKRTVRGLEKSVGYLVHAQATRNSLKEMEEDLGLRSLMLWLGAISIREEDKDAAKNILLPIAEETANSIMEAMESEGVDWEPAGKEPDFNRAIWNITWAIILKETMEQLRYEFTSRNSSGEQWPHPHQGCLDGIIETGDTTRSPENFEEGRGYNPRKK